MIFQNLAAFMAFYISLLVFPFLIAAVQGLATFSRTLIRAITQPQSVAKGRPSIVATETV